MEGAGTVSFCIVTNVTLNGSHSASGVVQTVDVTAKGQSCLEACTGFFRNPIA